MDSPTRLLGVSATDRLTYLSAALLLSAVATLATWIPARRAAGMRAHGRASLRVEDQGADHEDQLLVRSTALTAKRSHQIAAASSKDGTFGTQGPAYLVLKMPGEKGEEECSTSSQRPMPEYAVLPLPRG